MKFRKKAIEVEAVQWTGTPESLDGIRKMCPLYEVDHFPFMRYLLIHQYKEKMQVNIYDWVVMEANGEVCLCSPESFEETYEKGKMEDRIIIDKKETGIWIATYDSLKGKNGAFGRGNVPREALHALQWWGE